MEVLQATNGENITPQSRRGRGRARGRGQGQHENTTTPGLVNNFSSQHNAGIISTNNRHLAAHDGRFEDALSERASDKKQSAVISRQFPSAKERHKYSDRQKSASPKLPSRSRKSNFDTGVMSQINSYLQKGKTDRSDSSATRSLDRKTKESSSPRVSCLRSQNLHLQIPALSLSSESIPTNVAGTKDEERPRSMSQPLSPTSQGTTQPVPVLSGSASQIHQDSHSVSVSTAKTKGRGRARGRARPRHQDTDLAHTAPGVNCQLHLTEPQSDPGDQERFVDARDNSSSPVPAAFVDGVSNSREDCRGPSVEENGKQADKTNPLRLDIGEKSDVAEGAETFSPDGIDDITQLLSPNHEYVLDWAAAMETPTPDTSSDSVPNWSIADTPDNH